MRKQFAIGLLAFGLGWMSFLGPSLYLEASSEEPNVHDDMGEKGEDKISEKAEKEAERAAEHAAKEVLDKVLEKISEKAAERVIDLAVISPDTNLYLGHEAVERALGQIPHELKGPDLDFLAALKTSPQVSEIVPVPVEPALAFIETNIVNYTAIELCQSSDCLVDQLMGVDRVTNSLPVMGSETSEILATETHPEPSNISGPMDHAIRQIIKDKPTPVSASLDAVQYYETLQEKGVMPQYTQTSIVVFEGLVLTNPVDRSSQVSGSEENLQTVSVRRGEMARIVPVGENDNPINKNLTSFAASEILKRSEEKIEPPSPDTHGAVILNVLGEDATVILPGNPSAEPLQKGMELPEKASLQTGDGTSVEAAFFNHGKYMGRVQLDESTHILIASLAGTSPQQDTTKLVSALGKTTIEFEKSKNDSQFVVETPTASASVRGTVFQVNVSGEE
ncbi:MAG: FecR domain-containing protein [Candidatus Omnitrophica bacterium]|nr:FecR domain-containing protein [Candidatus Omnitrophota bacterium]